MSYANQKTIANPLPDMPSEERFKLDKLLQIQASSDNEKMIYFYLKQWLDERNIPNYTDESGNLICQKGEGNMQCIVSHMDTVHKIYKDYQVLYSRDNNDNNIIAYAKSGKQTVGVKGDDQCGIFACLYMLEKLDNIKSVFFSREEVGLIGSSEIDHAVFDNCGSIIQLDRWGSSDFISIYNGFPTINDDFTKIATPILKEYNYAIQEGLITDSINLFNDNVGISCVNISCGYYSHHSNTEIIDVNELWNSIQFTHALLLALGDQKYEQFSLYRGYGGVSRYGGGGYSEVYDDFYESKYGQYNQSYYKYSKADVYKEEEEDKIKNMFGAEEIQVMREIEPYIDDFLECSIYDSDAWDYVNEVYAELRNNYYV